MEIEQECPERGLYDCIYNLWVKNDTYSGVNCLYETYWRCPL